MQWEILGRIMAPKEQNKTEQKSYMGNNDVKIGFYIWIIVTMLISWLIKELKLYEILPLRVLGTEYMGALLFLKI